MILEVRRQLIPSVPDYQWEMPFLSPTVWKWDDGIVSIPILEIPTGFVRGLLRSYLNDELVLLEAFDVYLERVGWNRGQIEHLLREHHA